MKRAINLPFFPPFKYLLDSAPWSVASHIEDVTPDEMAKRAAAAGG
jgi:hypothetical protein